MDDDNVTVCTTGSTSNLFPLDEIICCIKCGYALKYTYIHDKDLVYCVECYKQSKRITGIELCIFCHYSNNIISHKCTHGSCTHRKRCVAKLRNGYRCTNWEYPNHHSRCRIHWKYDNYMNELLIAMNHPKLYTYKLPNEILEYILKFAAVLPELRLNNKSQSRMPRCRKKQKLNGITAFYK